MTCISLMRQNGPGSLRPSAFSAHLRIRQRTCNSLRRGVVSHLATLFFHRPEKTWDRESQPPGGCTASYAFLEYPTRTLGLRKTPLVRDAGLSAWMRQHSEPSRWYSASVSSIPRNLRPWTPVKTDGCIATIPFQQLDTGTGAPRSTAFLELEDRKYGQVWVAYS